MQVTDSRRRRRWAAAAPMIFDRRGRRVKNLAAGDQAGAVARSPTSLSYSNNSSYCIIVLSTWKLFVGRNNPTTFSNLLTYLLNPLLQTICGWPLSTLSLRTCENALNNTRPNISKHDTYCSFACEILYRFSQSNLPTTISRSEAAGRRGEKCRVLSVRGSHTYAASVITHGNSTGCVGSAHAITKTT